MDRTPAPAANYNVNSSVEAYRRLLNVPAMVPFAADREAVHGADAADYTALLAAIQGMTRAQRVRGDRWWSIWWRNRKVENPVKQMVEGSKLSAKGAEGLRLAFPAYVSYMAELPRQRDEQAARRAGRRAVVGAVTAKALHKSTAAAAPAPAPEAPAAEQQPQQGGQVRGITELWDRRGA